MLPAPSNSDVIEIFVLSSRSSLLVCLLDTRNPDRWPSGIQIQPEKVHEG